MHDGLGRGVAIEDRVEEQPIDRAAIDIGLTVDAPRSKDVGHRAARGDGLGERAAIEQDDCAVPASNETDAEGHREILDARGQMSGERVDDGLQTQQARACATHGKAESHRPDRRLLRQDLAHLGDAQPGGPKRAHQGSGADAANPRRLATRSLKRAHEAQVAGHRQKAARQDNGRHV